MNRCSIAAYRAVFADCASFLDAVAPPDGWNPRWGARALHELRRTVEAYRGRPELPLLREILILSLADMAAEGRG